jgi:N-acyl amino acid synthase of PEP-CTERM/exosortase system
MGLSLLDAEALDLSHAFPQKSALALRYQVYCEEFGYLPAQDYPAGLESDEDDAGSAHFHCFTSDLGEDDSTFDSGAARDALAGYVRLVRPDAQGQLPVQRRCQLDLDTTAWPDPLATAEVSRLIIAPEFRRSRGATSARGESSLSGRPTSGRRPLPTDVLLQLFRQMYDHSRTHGIRYWFAAMERPLARSLAQMGFPFKAAGPEGEYFGRITPYVADIHDLQTRVLAKQPRLADWLLAPRAKVTGSGDRAFAFHGLAHRPPPPQLWHVNG